MQCARNARCHGACADPAHIWACLPFEEAAGHTACREAHQALTGLNRHAFVSFVICRVCADLKSPCSLLVDSYAVVAQADGCKGLAVAALPDQAVHGPFWECCQVCDGLQVERRITACACNSCHLQATSV